MIQLIAITPPHFIEGEVEIWERLFDWGLERLHVRKPDATAGELRDLLIRLKPVYYNCVALHDHFQLAAEFDLGGIHLNGRNPVKPVDWKGRISRSCHGVDELRNDVDYSFLSPVFDSLSKSGYTAKFDLEKLRQIDLKNVYALGGVTVERFRAIKEAGFTGAAVLGALWTGDVLKNWEKLWKNSFL